MIGSAIWSPIRLTGFRAFIAPWKMIEISFHRMPRIESSESFTRFLPRNRIEPRTMRPLYGRRRMSARAVVVFPHPLSPAKPSASPSSRANDMPSTACTVPFCVVYSMTRSSTSSRDSLAPPEARIEDFVERVSEQVEPEDQEHDAEAGDDEPPRVPGGHRVVALRLRHDAAPADVLPEGQVEEGEDAFGQNRDGDREDRFCEDEGERVREDVAEQDVRAGRANRLGAFDEHPLLQAEDLAADHAGGDRPSAQADDEGDSKQVNRSEPRRDKEHDDEARDWQDDVVEAHDDVVDPAPDKAGEESDRRADHARDDGGQDADEQRDLRPPDDLRENVVAEPTDAHEVLRARRRERGRIVHGLERPVRRDPRGGERQKYEEDEDAESRHRGLVMQDLLPDLRGAAARDRELRSKRRDHPRPRDDDLGRDHRSPHVILILGSSQSRTKSEIRLARTTATPPITMMNCSTGRSCVLMALIVHHPIP